MTKSQLDRARLAMMSSARPSAKYSWSWSPLRLANGSTAIDGLVPVDSTVGGACSSMRAVNR